MHRISVKTTSRCQLANVTRDVASVVDSHGADASAVLLYVPHTTAGITINEAADPDVVRDIEGFMAEHVPQSRSFRHSEGNSDSHIKSSLIGPSLVVPLDGGRMALGTWQGLFFAEFDGPRSRNLFVQFLA